MDYIITPEQLDKITKPFFDKEFKDVEWGEQVKGRMMYGMV